MITALSTPSSGRVLLDANNTVIKLQSTNGEGYYFRAKIFINDILYDEQGWSRSDAYTATKDLKKLFNAYFQPVFNSSLIAGITEQTHLIRKVNILIEEYALDDGNLMASLNLPVFYIMYNVRPESFSDTSKVRILGIEPEVMVAPVNGKIAIPFYVNATGENIIVFVETGDGTVLDDYPVNSAQTGKKIFLFKLALASYHLSRAVEYIVIRITMGSFQTTKKVRLIHAPDYPIKEIVFMNNFGYYLYAYPMGEMETESAYSAELFETADGKQKVAEINEEATYTINSGNFKSGEKAIIGMIATSPDTKINLAVNQRSNVIRLADAWADMVPKTKKHVSYRDKQHNYSDNLVFSVRRGIDVANTGMISVIPATPDIEITDVDVAGSFVTLTFVLNNGFSSENIRLQYKPVTQTSWSTQPFMLGDSPVTWAMSPGTFNIRLVDFNNLSNVSNQVTATTT